MGDAGRGGEEPRPRQACGCVCVCMCGVFAARAGCTPSASAPRPLGRAAAAPAPLAPPGVVGQHGPGRGAAEDRQKAGEDGGQEKHGEAAEFGPQLPPPGGAARASPGVPGARAGAAPRRRGLNSRPKGGAAGAGLSALWGLLGTPEWMCAWLGTPGESCGPRKRDLCSSLWTLRVQGPRGSLCRAQERE